MTAASSGPDRQVADMAGPSALPRKNGELVFEEAWEGRVFGLATAMHAGQISVIRRSLGRPPLI